MILKKKRKQILKGMLGMFKSVLYLNFHLHLYKKKPIQNCTADINVRCPFKALSNSREGMALINSF